ncbi:MAG: hypothetical protein IJ105_02475 [Bacilli bacterium]|nr:hypothetical protein [Bacilli bacterium]
MNEILQNIMLFINEHTLLLIGICVFLILVLIGYLIDNSVKSRRIKRNIKNTDQVPKNIKEEIIKEAEDKAIKKEEPVVLENLNDNQEIQEEITSPIEQSLELNSSGQPSLDINLDNNMQISSDAQTPVVEDTPSTINNEDLSNAEFPSLDLNNTNDILDIKEENSLPQQDINIDPDLALMNNVSTDEYTNDKKLSEILFDIENSNIIEKEENNNNIFTSDSSNIVVNNDVKKDDVQIQNNDNASDELDRIMRKLSTMNNSVEDDNYTNIF